MVVFRNKSNWKSKVYELEYKKLITFEEGERYTRLIESNDPESWFLVKSLIENKVREKLAEGLNEGQKKAFDKIIEFSLGAEEYDAAVLTGYAGTGKTYLVKKFIEHIAVNNDYVDIAVTAPTNKAVKVLKTSASFSNDSDAEFKDLFGNLKRIHYCTVHSLLDLKEQITKTGQQTFKQAPKSKRENLITKCNYLIVDEVSMLDDELFKMLIAYRDSVKIIFMGDPAQIPPVNKIDSIPLLPQTKYNFLKLHLDEIMRQKSGNPVIDASMRLRDNLTVEQPISSLHTNLNSKDEGIIHINGKTERSKVRDVIEKYYVSDEYKKNPDYIKAIAWTNAVVRKLNLIIRGMIFGDEVEKYVKGDRLIASKPLFDQKEGRWLLTSHTSDEFTVLRVDKTKRTHNIDLFTKFTAEYWELLVKDHGTGGRKTLYVICEHDKDRYKHVLTELKDRALLGNSGAAWIPYYDAMKWSHNIDYAYAITAHKSQGSTYDNVLLIEEDIDKNRKTVERNRIKYTSYTRTKEKLFVLS